MLTPTVRPACEFYMGMGFRLSEYIVHDGSDDLRAVFLQRKGNPHDIVFVNNAGPRLHHAAFTIPEVYHLMYICDLLGRNGFGAGVEWGPGRHFGPGYARFVYLRDPGRPPHRAVHQPLPDDRHRGRADPLAGVRSQHRPLGADAACDSWLQEGERVRARAPLAESGTA